MVVCCPRPILMMMKRTCTGISSGWTLFCLFIPATVKPTQNMSNLLSEIKTFDDTCMYLLRTHESGLSNLKLELIQFLIFLNFLVRTPMRILNSMKV
mmetsp:Transcript_31748/g.74733  ORF Transcript_31748/g.74733 Transcript_31748/m.74733 type:complete len:97 (+) Transcript_31748:41-331(+)